jgi:hypothetical protein
MGVNGGRLAVLATSAHQDDMRILTPGPVMPDSLDRPKPTSRHKRKTPPKRGSLLLNGEP